MGEPGGTRAAGAAKRLERYIHAAGGPRGGLSGEGLYFRKQIIAAAITRRAFKQGRPVDEILPTDLTGKQANEIVSAYRDASTPFVPGAVA